MITYIIDNGESYSAHELHFVKVNTPTEEKALLAFLNLQKQCHDPPSVVAKSKNIEFTNLSSWMSVERYIDYNEYFYFDSEADPVKFAESARDAIVAASMKVPASITDFLEKDK